jgi:uncharacterized membrane protein YeaQ/YmgE (transglycosylase-associated protein family)
MAAREQGGTARAVRRITMPIVMTLIIGFVAGALARLVTPSKEPGGMTVTVVLGVAGAFIAGILGHMLGWYHVGEGPGILASLLGAVVLLAIYRLLVVRDNPAWSTR